MKRNYHLLTLLFLIFTSHSTIAATFTCVASGDWEEPATWDGSGVPGASDIAIIPEGFAVTVDSNAAALEVNIYFDSDAAEVTSLTINANTTLAITDSLTLHLGDAVSAPTQDMIVTNNGTLNVGRQIMFHMIGSNEPRLNFNNNDTVNVGNSSDGAFTFDDNLGAGNNRYNNNAGAITYQGGGVTTVDQAGRITSSGANAIWVFDGGAAIDLEVSTANRKFHDIRVEGTSTELDMTADVTSTLSLGGTISIESGATLDMNGQNFTTGTFEGLTINDGGTLKIPTGSSFPSSVFTTKTLTGTTEFTASGASVTADAFGDLTLSGGGTVTFTSGASASGTVTLSNSTTMDCGSSTFTFASSASASAHLADVPSGSSITNTCIVQRWIPTIAGSEWHILGNPLNSNPTISSALHDDMTTTGFTNSEYDGYSFVSVRTYNTSGSAWADATDANTQTWDNNATFAVFLGSDQDDERALDWEGTPNQGDVTLNSIVFGGTNYNLIGNPHPAYISLNSLISSGFTNVSGNVYLLTDAGGYATKDNDDGAFLAPGEGMWIETTGASPSVAFNESFKSDPGAETYRTYKGAGTGAEKPEFNVQLTVEGYYVGGADYVDADLEITKLDGATEDFDLGLDAVKFHHPDAYPGLVAVSEDNQSLIKNRIPLDDEAISIPLRIEFPADYGYLNKLNIFNTEKMLAKGNCLTFEDQNAGISFPITKDTVYTFMSPEGTVGYIDNGDGGWLQGDTIAGMYIHITSGASTQSLATSCSYNADGAAIAIPVDDNPYDITWTNQSGDVVQVKEGVIGADTLADVLGGTYHALIENGACGSDMSLDILVDQPSSIKAKFSGNGLADEVAKGAQIDFVNESINGYSFEWNFGDGNSSFETAPSHIYDKIGQYDVQLVAFDGNCSDTSVYKVEVVEAINTQISEIATELTFINRIDHSEILLNGLTTAGEVNVYNQLGQFVDVNTSFDGSSVLIYHPSDAGVYVVVVETTGGTKRMNMVVR